MNNPAGEINMWCESKPPPVVPYPLSFTDWLYSIKGLNISDIEYTSRAMAGLYLSHGFSQIASNLPANVDGKYIVGEVVDLCYESGKYFLTMKDDKNDNYGYDGCRFDHVLLSTGHPIHRETDEVLTFQSFADDHETARYIPNAYPVDTVFSDIPPNCSVGLKGMGLTFVDAALALTEGKGGRFERDEITDKLVYKPAGNEPRFIYPFSRSGLPMIPRKSVANVSKELLFFTRSALQRFENGKKLNFQKQLWPLLIQDMIYAHYDIAMKNAGQPDGLTGCNDFEAIEHLIADYQRKYPSEAPFDVDFFLEPLKETDIHKGKSHHVYIKLLYNDYLQEARKGELSSPLAAVTAVWSKASALFCEVYAFGGLSPESQQGFEHSFRSKLNRVTYGPPVESAEKLFALMECGILNFNAARNPDLILDEEKGSFVLKSGCDSTLYPIQYLVDARIPKMSLDNDPGTLFRNLLHRGLITLFENRVDNEVFMPGAVNITRDGFVIDKNGSINHRIAVTGTPTEGITYDNDTLSRDRNNFVDGWAEFISKEYSKSTLIHHAS